MVCIVFVLLGASSATLRRHEVWNSEESLWRDVTQKSPLNGRGWMNYGLALMSRGEYLGADAAFKKLLKPRRITPTSTSIWVFLMKPWVSSSRLKIISNLLKYTA